MTRTRSPLSLILVLAVLSGVGAPVLAADASAATSAKQKAALAKKRAAAAKRCAGRKPTLVAFTPSAGGLSGVVSWRRPLLPRTGRLHYRVIRDRSTVGQTRARRLSVRVTPGRQVRITVLSIRANGRSTGCAATIVRDLRRERPTSPTQLTASDVDETGATLRWVPGKVKVGRLAGTRVFRDGEPLRQVPGTSLRVALGPNRTSTFTAATVDTTGYVSALSAPVTLRSDHRAPSAPSGLTASGVTASAFTLRWSPSSVAGGRVTGYRVFRDGAPIRQVPGTDITVDGLAPAKSYVLTVTAVDNFGYESAPSVPLTVGTERPVQSTGSVHAFLLASTGASFTALREHYRQVDTVYPTYYECAADGSVSGRDDPLVTSWSQLHGIKVMPRMDCQSPTRLHAVLTNPGIRSGVLARLSELVATHGYDGLNIDFEAGAASDRDALTSFVTELATRLHGQGKKVSVAVSATTKVVTSGRAAFYDYAALGAVADSVFVMNWGKHWSTSAPGAIADLPWATQVADFIATLPNKERYVLGTGLYGFDWPAGGGPAHPATALEWADVQNLIAATGATPVFDPVAGAPHFSYTDAAGVPHEVWFTDATSLREPIRLAAARGLGFGVWRLGREDPRFWEDPLLAPGELLPPGATWAR